MQMHVLGLGPVGCLVAHHLRRALPANLPISIIHKTQGRLEKARMGNVVKMETSGVVVNAQGFRHEVHEEPSSADPEPAEPTKPLKWPKRPIPPIQSLIVCLKTYQTMGALRALSSRIGPDSTIVLLQNGMGIYECLVENLFQDPEKRPSFVLASNTHGVWLKDYLHVVHAGLGEIQLGIVPNGNVDFERSYPNPNLDDIAPDPSIDPNHRYSSLRSTLSTLTSVKGLNATWRSVQDVQILMRRKVVVNSVINPLTALMNCQNGQLFEHDAARAIATKVCREAYAAFHAQWNADIEAAKLAGEAVPYTPFPKSLTSTELMDECIRVAYLTKGNISSMLTDVRWGKYTEIHSMNGYLITLGKQYGLPMHANKMLLHLIKLRSNIPLSPL